MDRGRRLDCLGVFPAKPRLSDDHVMVERTLCGLSPGINAVADRSALHEDDRVVAVSADRRCRKARDVPGLARPCNQFEADGRQVVALIEDDVPVLRDQIIHDSLAADALQQGDVNGAQRLAFARANLADARPLDVQELNEALDPLVEQLLAMDEHQSADATLCDQTRCHHGLAERGGSGKHAGLMCEQGAERFLLVWPEVALELELDRQSALPLV